MTTFGYSEDMGHLPLLSILWVADPCLPLFVLRLNSSTNMNISLYRFIWSCDSTHRIELS